MIPWSVWKPLCSMEEVPGRGGVQSSLCGGCPLGWRCYVEVQELFGPVLLVCSASLYSGSACCRMSCGGIFLYQGGPMARVVVVVSQTGGVWAGSVSWRAVVFCWTGVCPLLGGVLNGGGDWCRPGPSVGAGSGRGGLRGLAGECALWSFCSAHAVQKSNSDVGVLE